MEPDEPDGRGILAKAIELGRLIRESQSHDCLLEYYVTNDAVVVQPKLKPQVSPIQQPADPSVQETAPKKRKIKL